VNNGGELESGCRMSHSVLTVGFVEDGLIVSSMSNRPDPGSLTHGLKDVRLNTIAPPSRSAASQALYGSTGPMASFSSFLSSADGFRKSSIVRSAHV
jgi:hypothetical protein